jgi:predicted nucleotidyltransferase
LYNLTSDLDIFLSSHENKYVSRWKGEVNLQDLLHSTIHVILTGRLGVECLNGECATRDSKARSGSIKIGKL